jgi:hypothetical protein
MERDALFDAGADLKCGGSSIDGSPPLSSAVTSRQWVGARRLVARARLTTRAEPRPMTRSRLSIWYRYSQALWTTPLILVGAALSIRESDQGTSADEIGIGGQFAQGIKAYAI